MRKIYLEVITSKYMPGTSMRDKDVEYVLLNNPDIPECFSSDDITEAIKKYSEENDVMLGRAYNNAMTGTNMYQDQKYSTIVFVERENRYFDKILIENITSVYLNWLVSTNYWEYRADQNSFCVAKRRSSF